MNLPFYLSINLPLVFFSFYQSTQLLSTVPLIPFTMCRVESNRIQSNPIRAGPQHTYSTYIVYARVHASSNPTNTPPNATKPAIPRVSTKYFNADILGRHRQIYTRYKSGCTANTNRHGEKIMVLIVWISRVLLVQYSV